MAAISPFPPYDLSKFSWRLPVGDSNRAVREGCGGEVLKDCWNRYCMGNGTLFMGLYLNLSVPVLETTLAEAAKETWGWLRFYVPGVASRTEKDENDKTIVVYNIADDADDVDDWVGRTFQITKQSNVDLDELRYKLGPEKIPTEAGDQTFLHLVPGPEASDGTVSSFGLLIHTLHIAADAAGLKIWMNRYLGRLSTILSSTGGKPKDRLQWGWEAINLLPASAQVLHPSEAVPLSTRSLRKPTVNHPYYASLGEMLTELVAGPQNAYGIQVRPFPAETQDGSEWPRTRRLGLSLTKAESNIILERRRPVANGTSTNKGYTVNHIAHAALSMVIVNDKPPSAESNPNGHVYFNGIVDGRYRLQEPYSISGQYPGYCLTMSAIAVPIKHYQANDGAALAFDKDALVRTARTIKEQYAKQKAYPALLGGIGQMCEILTDGMKAAIAANVTIPPTYSPWFSADGVGEKFLDNVHHDGAGKPIIDVDRLFTSLNTTDPAPFFRIHTWKGIIELSVDFNEKKISREVVEGFLARWKEFMLLIAEFDAEDYE